MVLNIDRSSLGNPGRAGFGGLIRQCNGMGRGFHWIFGCCVHAKTNIFI